MIKVFEKLMSENNSDLLLNVKNLNLNLKNGERSFEILKNVDFSVKYGECVGIVGESGAGKSMLARAITRLMPGNLEAELQGEVFFKDFEILKLKGDEFRKLRVNSGFSMVFQDPLGYLNPTKRIWKQVSEALSEENSTLTAFERVTKLLVEVGLPQAERMALCYPHELSGGMRQRVMIAMALASEPDLLFADEPTTALDPTVQLQVLDTLRRLHRDRGMAIVIITHDLGVIAELCDKVYVMRHGEVIETADTVSLFENPQHPYTKELLLHSRADYANVKDARDKQNDGKGK